MSFSKNNFSSLVDAKFENRIKLNTIKVVIFFMAYYVGFNNINIY